MHGEDICLLKLWLKLLVAIYGKDSLRAFPDFSGAPLSHLERRIAASAKDLGHTLPTSTEFRKEVKIRNRRLEGPTREGASRALSHSIQTADLYYQAPTVDDAFSAFTAIQHIIMEGRTDGAELTEPSSPLSCSNPPPTALPSSSQSTSKMQPSTTTPASSLNPSPSKKQRVHDKDQMSSAKKQRMDETDHNREAQDDDQTTEETPSHTKQKRKRFTPEEDALVGQYFAQGISTSMSECRDFLELYPIQDRKAKDMYDKVRNLAKKAA